MASKLNDVVFRIQFWVQINACTALGVKQLRYGSIIRPSVEKADFDATVDMRIANTSWAINDRTLKPTRVLFPPTQYIKIMM